MTTNRASGYGVSVTESYDDTGADRKSSASITADGHTVSVNRKDEILLDGRKISAGALHALEQQGFTATTFKLNVQDFARDGQITDYEPNLARSMIEKITAATQIKR